jgi:hypothetical protein
MCIYKINMYIFRDGGEEREGEGEGEKERQTDQSEVCRVG